MAAGTRETVGSGLLLAASCYGNDRPEWDDDLGGALKKYDWLLRYCNRRHIIVIGCSGAVILTVALVAFSVVFWDWLSGGGSGSETIRNIGLVAAGLIALPLAIWRAIVAGRQANTAQQGLLNERYQKGAAMLGNEVLSVRLGGIYALQRLAEDHPEQYHIQIMRLFCAFVRLPTRDQSLESGQGKLSRVLCWEFVRTLTL